MDDLPIWQNSLLTWEKYIAGYPLRGRIKQKWDYKDTAELKKKVMTNADIRVAEFRQFYESDELK